MVTNSSYGYNAIQLSIILLNVSILQRSEEFLDINEKNILFRLAIKRDKNIFVFHLQ